MDSNVKIAFVGGYVIHRYRTTPDRAKTDVLDCALLRDFGERYPDKLKYKTFPVPEEALYELRQLARHREMLVEQRKQLITADKSEDCRPIRSLAVKRSMDRIKEMLDTEIAETEKEMLKVINGHESIHHKLVKSVDGVGLITAVELLVKTENFTKITTARQYAAYAGTAPYEKSSGKWTRSTYIQDW